MSPTSAGGYLGPVRDFRTDELVHAGIERRAAETPAAVVAEQDGRQLTYAELDRLAGQLCGRLLRHGVRGGATVAVFANPSPMVLVAVHAVMKAGAAWLPVDPDYPAGRVATLLGDSAPAALIADDGLIERLPRLDIAVLPLTQSPSADLGLEVSVDGPVSATPAADEPACVIYTSGSTAAPKGVVITHRGLTNLARVASEQFGLQPGDRFLQLASVSFSAFLEEVFPSVLSGATVVFTDRQKTLTSVRELLRVLRDRAITGFGITTAYWHELVDQMLSSGDRFPPDLRFVLMGGERARAAQVTKWPRLGVRLVHVYGPTEVTATATYFDTGACDLGRYGEGRLPIGTTIPNMSVWLLDGQMRPVPEGEVGELYIGGVGLARGYHNSPGMTAARFVPDPFTAPGSRLYRTGDLGRCLDDGNLEFIGRVDDASQSREEKLRGYRFSVAEIETALESHPAIRRAVVQVREDTPGERRLVAYLVAQDGEAPTVGTLRAQLSTTLPAYLLPAAYVVLGRLPLTPHGKTDHAALPAPEAGRPALDNPFVHPAGHTEVALARMWSQTLDVAPVGATDGFLELGGDSLMATRILARIRAELGVEVRASDALRAGTVRELAAVVDELCPTAATGGAPEDELGPHRRKAGLIARALRSKGAPANAGPLSVSQQGLWVLHQLSPESPTYNVPLRLRLSGPLDVPAFAEGVRLVVDRHAPLRTVFVTAEGMACQVVRPASASDFELRTLDLSALSAAERATAAEGALVDEATKPFDLANGPVFRALLVRLDAEEFDFAYTAHHIVFDGWSAAVLLDEVTAAYTAIVAGSKPSLPELVATYADFAIWQRDRLKGPNLDRLLTYWTHRLAGAPESLDLSDRPRPVGHDAVGASLRLPLPTGLRDRLADVGATERATLFMVLLTGFYTTLHRHSGQTDLSVGSPVANRLRAEFEPLLGFFVNTVVLRAEVAGDPTFRTLLGQVRARCLDAYEHGELPFDVLVEHLNPPRHKGAHPLFQVNFAVDVAPGLDVRLPDIVAHHGHEASTGTAKFDLTWLVEDQGNELVVTVVYDRALFGAHDVTTMVTTYQTVLEAMTDDLDGRLSSAFSPASSGAADTPASVEEVLYGMWSEAFGGRSFALDDDFFELGGYSLLASELCIRIGEKFDVNLSLRAFFESPTVTELAARVRAAPRGRTIVPPPTRQDEKSLRDLLGEIESLSEDQVAAAVNAIEDKDRGAAT